MFVEILRVNTNCSIVLSKCLKLSIYEKFYIRFKIYPYRMQIYSKEFTISLKIQPSFSLTHTAGITFPKIGHFSAIMTAYSSTLFSLSFPHFHTKYNFMSSSGTVAITTSLYTLLSLFSNLPCQLLLQSALLLLSR